MVSLDESGLPYGISYGSFHKPMAESKPAGFRPTWTSEVGEQNDEAPPAAESEPTPPEDTRLRSGEFGEYVLVGYGWLHKSDPRARLGAPPLAWPLTVLPNAP